MDKTNPMRMSDSELSEAYDSIMKNSSYIHQVADFEEEKSQIYKKASILNDSEITYSFTSELVEA